MSLLKQILFMHCTFLLLLFIIFPYLSDGKFLYCLLRSQGHYGDVCTLLRKMASKLARKRCGGRTNEYNNFSVMRQNLLTYT